LVQSHNIGKVSRSFLHRVIYPRLGASRPEVLRGPSFGVDNAVVKLGNGKVLVTTTDPLSMIPSLGTKDSAWISVHLLASDLATSGFAPQFGIFDFNLPPRMRDSEFSDYWKSFHLECRRLGLAIIGGHTGRFEGCGFTIIGGGVMWAIGEEDRYLSSNMAMEGDEILLTKSVAVGATGVLARTFPKTSRKALGPRLFEKASGYVHKMSTVKDALTAVSVGVREDGVTAMHDATEGGVIAAMLELAEASNLALELNLTSLPISQETQEICRLFRIDPFTSLSEGTLIIASRPNKTEKVMKSMSAAGIDARLVGRLTSNSRTHWGKGPKGHVKIHYPAFDPYWSAFWKATKKGWK
jgi:hydrogenase expression/formation protein HypE